MSINATPEEKMGSLHAVVAETLIEQLEGIPIVDDAGTEIGRQIDPRVLSAAITFLNNNKVLMNPFLSEAVSKIEEQLSNKTKRFAVIKDEAIAAAKKAASSGG